MIWDFFLFLFTVEIYKCALYLSGLFFFQEFRNSGGYVFTDNNLDFSSGLTIVLNWINNWIRNYNSNLYTTKFLTEDGYVKQNNLIVSILKCKIKKNFRMLCDFDA